MSVQAGGRRYTLLTGGTGFIGHVLAAELLHRGHDCALLTRRAGGAAVLALTRLLGELGLDAASLVEQGRVVLLEGSLPETLPDTNLIDIARIVHSAASTRFDTDDAGEPARTNDLGTEALLAWATRHNIREFHLISTAFAGGVAAGPVPERALPAPRAFRNAYEESKWTAERHAHRWAERQGCCCTIYRPSIVVGDHSTGRASRFSGLYLALRAYERYARGGVPAGKPGDVKHLPMRIEGRGSDRLNFIPVDHVARLIADIIDRPAHHGMVYNLVDPRPPSNHDLLGVIERYYGVSGDGFIDPAAVDSSTFNELERAFSASIRSLRPYIVEATEFERSNTAAVEAALARPWPRWDEKALRRLIDVARQRDWGRGDARSAVERPDDHVASYFERFLPARIACSGLAGMTALTTTFRFVVEDISNGEWVCRFHEGRLTGVKRGVNGVHEDFAYRMNTEAFWDIVSARVDPQSVFLEGRAEVSGDIEQALKMGMILQQFNREHPYRAVATVTAQEDGGDV